MLALEGTGKKSMYLQKQHRKKKRFSGKARCLCAGRSWNGLFFREGHVALRNRNTQGDPVSPVNTLVVIRAIEELNFLKGAGARKVARHSRVQAQEEVDSCGACMEDKDQPVPGKQPAEQHEFEGSKKILTCG